MTSHKCIRSPENCAHDLTALLSGHVHNFVVIRHNELKLFYRIFFGIKCFERKISSKTGPLLFIDPGICFINAEYECLRTSHFSHIYVVMVMPCTNCVFAMMPPSFWHVQNAATSCTKPCQVKIIKLRQHEKFTARGLRFKLLKLKWNKLKPSQKHYGTQLTHWYLYNDVINSGFGDHYNLQ